jgi:hypothetical protein
LIVWTLQGSGRFSEKPSFAITSHFGAQKSWMPVAYFYEDITAGEAYLVRMERFEQPSQEAIDVFLAIQKTIAGLKA